jgi:CHAT domain-containing protein
MEQKSLPIISLELGDLIEREPLLQSDKRLRLFAYMVKGDVDGELDPVPARQDWNAVLTLAKDLNDEKWIYRSTAEIGFSDYLQGNFDSAFAKVFGSLAQAKAYQDLGAQIRLLGAIGTGLAQAKEEKQNIEALGYFDRADQITAATSDAGYQFIPREGRLQALRHLRRYPEATELGADMLSEAMRRKKYVKAAQVLITSAGIDKDQHKYDAAIQKLQRSIALSSVGHMPRLLADAQMELADIYRLRGALDRAQPLMKEAARSTQSSGDLFLLPGRLGAEAQLEIALHRYGSAVQSLERASVFADSMIGRVNRSSSKLALILGQEEVFRSYVDLEAGVFHDVPKTYAVIESVRGRVSRDILMNGSAESPKAQALERQLSRLYIQLSRVQTTRDARTLRDRIFYLEQNRWEETGTSILRSKLNQVVPLRTLQLSLAPGEAILEYMLGDSNSYCLVIDRSRARLVQIPQSQHQIDSLVLAYLEKVRAHAPAVEDAQRLHSLLLPKDLDIENRARLIVVPDGSLHLLPFEALQAADATYVIQAHEVTYAPSASALYFLKSKAEETAAGRAPEVLAVGGIPYSESEVARAAKTRGYDSGKLGDLPASEEEARTATDTLRGSLDRNRLLVERDATESAFKHADLLNVTVIHMAVHGLANQRNPDRAALILLSDPKAGEDGWLQTTEIALLKTRAELVVLSACDTAIGPINGEEGIANLNRAFLLSGARNVISSLWPVDDTFSLFLMKHFYAHLAEQEPVASALRHAKLDLLHTFRSKATPYFWAAFKLEGNGNVNLVSH